MAKYTEKEVSDLCALHGHVYLRGYVGARDPFDCVCSCGELWSPVLSTIQRKSTCGKCARNVPYTDKQITEELLSYSLKLLKPYTGALLPLIYECSCGGIGKTTIGNIRQGKKCGHCTEMQWRDYFLDYNCEVINYISAKQVTYRCSCGEVATVRTKHFEIGWKRCSKCREYWNTNPNATQRPGLYAWKKAIVTRDNFECQLCSEDSGLQIHHIEAYSVRPELAADEDNGITLCYDCHRDLHSKYGIQVGRENLLKELSYGRSAA